MIYFISDTHFSHFNILKYCNRPFKTIEEMNKTMIDNWNSVVKKDDIVYHLGDFGFGDIGRIRKQLNGQIILIRGGHDRIKGEQNNLFLKIYSLYDLTVEEQSITLCHYCMRVWNKSHFNAYMLYGHSHGQLQSEGKSYDVGVDTNNFTPVSFEQIKEIMKSKPDNFNIVKNNSK